MGGVVVEGFDFDSFDCSISLLGSNNDICILFVFLL